jgi:hypothetical protein
MKGYAPKLHTSCHLVIMSLPPKIVYKMQQVLSKFVKFGSILRSTEVSMPHPRHPNWTPSQANC